MNWPEAFVLATLIVAVTILVIGAARGGGDD